MWIEYIMTSLGLVSSSKHQEPRDEGPQSLSWLWRCSAPGTSALVLPLGQRRCDPWGPSNFFQDAPKWTECGPNTKWRRSSGRAFSGPRSNWQRRDWWGQPLTWLQIEYLVCNWHFILQPSQRFSVHFQPEKIWVRIKRKLLPCVEDSEEGLEEMLSFVFALVPQVKSLKINSKILPCS